jgi:hypothetical protein
MDARSKVFQQNSTASHTIQASVLKIKLGARGLSTLKSVKETPQECSVRDPEITRRTWRDVMRRKTSRNGAVRWYPWNDAGTSPARSSRVWRYTHSAFRRLVAELGGCGAMWTEMLAARHILSENFRTSPWLRRRPQENSLIYQLMVSPNDPVERILDQLGEAGVDALDLNLACNARSVRSCSAGSALFENLDGLRAVLHKVHPLASGSWCPCSLSILCGHKRS